MEPKTTLAFAKSQTGGTFPLRPRAGPVRRRCRDRPCGSDGRAVEARMRRLDSLRQRRSEIARAFRPIVDKQVSRSSAVFPTGYWGGQYRTATGESVTIYASNSYPVDPALGQRWADFLGIPRPRPEISTVTVLLATSLADRAACGADAVACYSPQGAVLYTPGEDPGSDLSAEAVITHEYGHHVAANRSNAPWSALDWGPKRWASAMQVCASTRAACSSPALRMPALHVEPREGWAETYRVLNERKAGRPETPWQIVTPRRCIPRRPRSPPPSRT